MSNQLKTTKQLDAEIQALDKQAETLKANRETAIAEIAAAWPNGDGQRVAAIDAQLEALPRVRERLTAERKQAQARERLAEGERLQYQHRQETDAALKARRAELKAQAAYFQAAQARRQADDAIEATERQLKSVGVELPSVPYGQYAEGIGRYERALIDVVEMISHFYRTASGDLLSVSDTGPDMHLKFQKLDQVQAGGRNALIYVFREMKKDMEGRPAPQGQPAEPMPHLPWDPKAAWRRSIGR